MNNDQLIASLIHIDGVSEEEITSLLTQPKDLGYADVALPCFRFAKALRKSPVEIANTLAAEISQNLPSFLLSCTALNGRTDCFQVHEIEFYNIELKKATL